MHEPYRHVHEMQTRSVIDLGGARHTPSKCAYAQVPKSLIVRLEHKHTSHINAALHPSALPT